MKAPTSPCLLPAVLLATALPLMAQFNSPQPSTGIDAAMTKLFGDVKAFTARSEIQATMGGTKDKMTMISDFALLDGKTRSDLDMANLKSAQLPPQAMQGVKQMGMDRVTTISRPDKKLLYLIYPGLQAYVEMPIPEKEAAELEKNHKIEITAVGKETIDGQPCVKNRVVMTDEQGKKREGFTWNAANLKNFPIQMQMGEGGDTFLVKYRDVKFSKPDAAQFEPPSGFARHTSQQSLMQQVMMKMMGSGGFPGAPGPKAPK